MSFGDVLDAETERIATQFVDAIYRVHTTLGPGLLESVYVTCLVIELEFRGLRVQREVPVPILCQGRKVEPGLRVDLLVEERIIIEAKAVEKMTTLFHTITKTYLKLASKRPGFLVNFNVPLINDGIFRSIL